MMGLHKYPFLLLYAGYNRNTHQGRIPQGNGNYLPANRAKPMGAERQRADLKGNLRRLESSKSGSRSFLHHEMCGSPFRTNITSSCI